jgi:hypothetical protein
MTGPDETDKATAERVRRLAAELEMAITEMTARGFDVRFDGTFNAMHTFDFGRPLKIVITKQVVL